MEPLRVHLFGRFSVQQNLQVVDGFDHGKVRELFCYLLLHRDHPQSREALAGLLWGESSAEHARRNLRQCLWQLQVALRSHVPESDGSPVIEAGPAWVSLHADADLWLDVMVFEKAFAVVRGVPGEEIGLEQARSVAEAVGLHTGSLLDGWYPDWCLQERERLEGMYRAMLAKLMGHCAVRGAYEAGLGYGERLLSDDRARESTHRQMMRLYYLNGDRTEALRQYERCVVALAEEFGVRPSRRTIALHEQIRADRLGYADRVSSGVPVGPGDRAEGV